MPIHEYSCSDCSITLERLETARSDSIYNSDAPDCPVCSAHMQLIISTGNFILKGKGFYKPTKDE